MNVVIDTSVAVAWYCNESFSLPAREWQDKIISGRVKAIVPSLHYLEFANVMRTYVRRGELKRDIAEEIFNLHLELPMEVIEPSKHELLSAAFEYEATVYDAAYIILARSYDCPVVTAERTTTPWVVKMGESAIIVG